MKTVQKFIHLFFVFFVAFGSGCSSIAPAYYPTRELALAEAAVAAAQDVHAQRLASAKYQLAIEELGKAKAAERDRRMGAAKRHSNWAREYAEEAEEISVMKLARMPREEVKQKLAPGPFCGGGAQNQQPG